MGQGTIVHGHYDIDIVLYSTSKFIQDLHHAPAAECEHYVVDMQVYCHVPEIQQKMSVRISWKDYIKKHLKNYVFLQTKVALKFKMGHLDVDLLLSPRWSNQDELFTYLCQVSPPSKRLM